MVVVNVVPMEQLGILGDVMSIWPCDNVHSFGLHPKLKFVEQYEHVYKSAYDEYAYGHVIGNVSG